MGKTSKTNPLRHLVLSVILAALMVAVSFQCAWSQNTSASVALQLPSAIAYDAQGNLYVAERAGHVVRRLAADGTVSMIAGTGTQGFSGDNGPATVAQLDSPQGLAVDSTGNVYIADTRNHRIREVVAATGLITTVAGTGKAGFSGDNGPAVSAQIDSPTALALDSAGNLFVADTRNHRVRRISLASGLIATVAGTGTEGFSGDNGPATAAGIDSPAGLAFDGANNLYLADTRNHRVRRVAAATGTITTVAGAQGGPGLPAFAGDGGPAVSASLALPRGLSVDNSGSVYVADSANQRIRRIAPDGAIATVSGQGTESFGGDGGAATAASLDAPSAIAVSPADLVTVADTANGRIRQLITSTTPAQDIHTILGADPSAGLARSAVVLTGPPEVTYGSGSATAALSAGSAATGSMTFLDTTGGAATVLGTVPLSGGSATLSTAMLPAGTRTIAAFYPGDAAYAAVQSQPLSVSVAPLAITVAAQPASILYGQPIPALTGTLNGVLSQDSGKVSVSFSITATGLPPVGSYPVMAVLGGPAAGNYTLASTSGSLSVNKAPTVTAVFVSSVSASAGAPVTFTLEAISSTAGIPTGAVTVLDGGSSIGQVTLINGAAAYTSSALAVGLHPIGAAYSGDANFLPSTAQPVPVTIGAGQDFTLAATGAAAQSIPSGSTATFAFSVAQGAALASPITLAVTGLPAGATFSMNPAYIPPGGSVTALTLSVQTTKTLAMGNPGGPGHSPVAFSAALLGPLFLLGEARRRRAKFPRNIFYTRLVMAVLGCISSATLASGCASRVNTVSEASAGQTYTLRITGTATSGSGTLLQHSVDVTLQVL